MSKSSEQSVKIFALLVGIDDYKSVPKLHGCVRDVTELQTLLINRFHVPAASIKTLADAQATRQGILDAFKTHLIENPAIKSGDQIVFHYSGHGSQMNSQSANEPDGLDETLVAYDSRGKIGGKYVYDIPDKTLAALIEQLAQAKGDNITIILDCCHSGSGTREVKLNTRRAPIDPTPLIDEHGQPLVLDSDIVAAARSGTRQITPSGWDDQLDKYVLLAGCRDSEESNEHPAGSNQLHGAMSYFLLQALSNMQPDSTYGDIHAQVAAQVNARYRDQMPQCEGQRDRTVFGGARLQRDPFILVNAVENDEVKLSAGLIQGLRVGTKLALYPETVKTLADLPKEPVAHVDVIAASATTAQAQVTDKRGEVKPLMRAVITEQQFERRAVSVHGEATDEVALTELRKLIGESAYLNLSETPTDLRISVKENNVVVQNGDQQTLTEPIPTSEAAVNALNGIARYQRLLALRNEDANSALYGALKLRLRQFEAGKKPDEMPIVKPKAGGDYVLDYSPALEKAKQCDFIIEIVNQSRQRVFPHLFYLDAEYTIMTFYPRHGQQEAIEPGKSLFCMSGAGGQNMNIFLPDNPRWDWSNEHIKLIGTLETTDLSMLDQKKLSVPAPGTRSVGAPVSALESLFNAAAQGKRQIRNDAVSADWGTAELPVRIVRVSGKRDLPPDAQDVPVLENELSLKKPAGMTGSLSVTPVEAGKRGGDDGVRPPPALEADPDTFQLLGSQGNTRDVGASGMAVDLEIDAATRAGISESNPLIFERSRTRSTTVADTGVYAIAFDGEDYLLVGQSDKDNPNEIAITHVPEPVITNRSIGSTIRFFFYKKIGRFTDELGLRYAVADGDKPIYSNIDKALFKPGQSVALMVHGFTSETNGMVTGLLPWLRQNVMNYDHCITFDYESFGTGVADNGNQLVLALRQLCGFNSDDKISVHVYAHSMGCLVSRCAVELSGGSEIIDKVVLAGPPNNGTTLASTGKGMAFIISQVLSRAVTGPIGGILRKGIDQLYKQGLGIADLIVQSDITRQINALVKPDNVLYLALVGLNSPDPTQQARTQRLAHKMLDTGLDVLFGEQNDGVIGKSSLQGVRNGGYPLLSKQDVMCDHFGYYNDSVALQAIVRFIQTAPKV